MKWLILLNLCLISIQDEQVQYFPLSDVLFKGIPTADTVRNIPITFMRETRTFYNSVLNCTTESKMSQIIEKVDTIGNKTCNGFVFSNENYLYYAVHSGKSIKLSIDAMTIVSAAMNGNIIFITCGYITEGICEGDFLFSVQIYKADDQNSCSDTGLISQTAVYYPLEVYGKCQSTCNLGNSTAQINPPLFNRA